MGTGRIDLRGDGRVIIWARGAKGIYQARIKVPNSTGFILKTTNTTKLHEATAFATNLYDELYYKVREGGTLKSSPTTEAVFKEWEKHDTRTKITSTVARYFVPFFRTTPLDKVTNLTDFWLHRTTNFIKKRPSNNTIIREQTYIKAMLRYAKAKGYITTIPELNPLETRPHKAKRPTFTPKEWTKLTDAIPSWLTEPDLATTRDRRLAADYFRLLYLTGMRIGEARNLHWTDIHRIAGDHVVFDVKGKTGEREALGLKGTIPTLDRLKAITGNHQLVFCHPDGTPIQSFKTAFASLLKHANVPVKGRTIYSLRHAFITGRLQAGVSAYHIAKQCGTSVEMIEKTYGHVVHREIAEQLTRQELVEGLGANLEGFLLP